MAELKTKATKASVAKFLNGIADEQVRKDAKAVAALMRKSTGGAPKMWGTNIVGFGSYRYQYSTGRQGDWFLVGFAPRKTNLTLYLVGGFKSQPELMKKLGKHKVAGSCLHIKTLEDVHVPTLQKLINASIAILKKREKALT